jgi:hypothetical protein
LVKYEQWDEMRGERAGQAGRNIQECCSDKGQCTKEIDYRHKYVDTQAGK